ncbi:MAG: PilZ domain [Pyrinomonadaceae bacterium]|nr:PilZ domain [Pyrinomonadaceae bacterium]MDX6270186.1 PilZ domain [Acidobacteriota bacterium]
MDNRRDAERVKTALRCHWGLSEDSPRNGNITSLSHGGCFVQTTANAAEEQLIYLSCWLPSQRWLALRGRVTYHLSKVGFGLTFTDLTDEQREMLALLIEYHREEQ